MCLAASWLANGIARRPRLGSCCPGLQQAEEKKNTGLTNTISLWFRGRHFVLTAQAQKLSALFGRVLFAPRFGIGGREREMDLRLPGDHANSGFQFVYAAGNVEFSLGKELSQNGVSCEVTRVRVGGLFGVRQACLVFPAL